MKKLVFISSVQKELAEERRALKDYIHGDALLGRFFEVFLFEDMPAADRRADEAYLAEVGRCDVYLGLLANEYGHEDGRGLSPTEREFDRATASGKQRLIFVKGDDDSARHPKMQAFVKKVGTQLIRRRFTDTTDLIDSVYASLVNHLQQMGIIQNRPFDEQICPGATLDDIDHQALADFVRRARAERQFPLEVKTPAADVLAHLHMLVDGHPTRAAVLLFGRHPQRFMSSAEVRCMRFHGTEIMRPAPSYQIFKGSLFEQVNRTTDFVLSVLNRSVGTRALSPRAPVKYEIPPDVVHEAIVNAIAHRDYASAGAIQVSVFSDRVEVWNPGTLPPSLTPEQLRKPHRSVARNSRVCEALFLAHHIEKYGTGTLMMIRESIENALPEPDFGQNDSEFSVTLWRNWLTDEVLAGMGLNARQLIVVDHLKTTREITNRQYQQIAGVTDRTALRDLENLVDKGVLCKVGSMGGRSTRYVVASETRHKPDKPDIAGQTEATPPKKRPTSQRSVVKKAQVGDQVGTKSGLSQDQVEVLRNSVTDKLLVELMKVVGRTNRTKFRDQVLNPLLADALLEMTTPNKPTSRLQKYRLTAKGRARITKESRRSKGSQTAQRAQGSSRPKSKPDKKRTGKTSGQGRKAKGRGK